MKSGQLDHDDSFAPQPNREPKTGLYWGMPFIERAEALFKEVDSSKWCVIAIDIDHFRLFNKWYGRDKGDTLLSMIGAELTEAERVSGGLAGYLGQDDFCLFAPYDENRIANLYNRLNALIAELAMEIGFKPAFGVSVSDGHTPFMDLFDQAKRALAFEHEDFKSDIILYDPSMRELDEREYRVLVDFQRGLRGNEFEVFLQPQCRISTGKIIAAEALARWTMPDGTVMSPEEFVPILEKHGFITDLDCFVWEHMCFRLRAWLDTGHQAVPVSLNVSRYDFYAIDVPGFFTHLLEEYGIPPSLIKLEITETAFVENDSEIADGVRRLRDMGLMVMLDDFGSGYSSLNRLGGLEVDGIKLDAAFFHLDEATRRKGIHIVESIINMTKTMALPIICEGVETKEQVEFLDSLGCRYIQGFYFYYPMSINLFEKLIENSSVIDEQGFVVKTNDQLRVREFLDENVYSDSMLNTILGPVAYYLWHDDTIDIIRFNEQFYEAVNVPDFDARLTDVPRFVPPEEVPKLFELFERAANDLLNGAEDIIGFYGADGSLARFIMRLYYLGENDEGKRFYGSVRDVTDAAEMQIQLKMLSKHLSMSIVFMRRIGDQWVMKLIIHGLASKMDLSYEQFQRELNDHSFFERVNPNDFEQLKKAALASIGSDEGFSGTFSLIEDAGEPRRFWLEADRASDSIGEASFFLKIVAL